MTAHEKQILAFFEKWSRGGVCETSIGTLKALIRGTDKEAKAAIRGLKDQGFIHKKPHGLGGMKQYRLFRNPVATVVQNRVARRSMRPKRQTVFQKTDGICHYCASSAETIDHMVPLSRGGSNDIENLIGACKKCNGDKGNATAEEYFETIKYRK